MYVFDCCVDVNIMVIVMLAMEFIALRCYVS